jgi:diguanylate cyclase (GGDEF)-like protein
MTDLGDAEIARSVSERLVLAMDAPFEIEGHTIRGTVSIGVAFYPSSSSSAIEIMQFADHAMYTAKRAGGNRVSYSEPDPAPDGIRASRV